MGLGVGAIAREPPALPSHGPPTALPRAARMPHAPRGRAAAWELHVEHDKSMAACRLR